MAIREVTLDSLVASLATATARKLMVAGLSAEDAATAACSGSWQEFRETVLVRLKQSAGPTKT